MALLHLNNLRISLRIAIACLLPLIAFTVFAGKALLEKQAALSDAQRIAEIAEAAPVISNLVHEMQKERGASAGFINSKGAAFADTLRNQRPATDKTLAGAQQRMAELAKANSGSKLARDLGEAQSKLGSVQATRAGVDGFTISTQQSTEYYTAAIAQLIAVIDSAATKRLP